MASFTYDVLGRTIMPGGRTVVWGSYSIGTSSKSYGDVNTQLEWCDQMFLSHKGTSVEAFYNVINETFPVAGTAVTVIGSSGDNGYWYALGR